MANSLVGSTLPGIPAAADLTTKQHHFVVIDSAGKAALAGLGARVDAALQNKPNTDEACSLWGTGSVTKVVAGAALTAGDSVASDASAQGKVAAGGEFIVGTCVVGAGSGEVASVWITMPGKA